MKGDEKMNVAQFCEIAMLLLFFVSWPTNIYKSVKSRTAKGRSVYFEILILIGYIAGAIGKIWIYSSTGDLAYSTIFYILNAVMVSVDIGLYVRNCKLDSIADAAAKK